MEKPKRSYVKPCLITHGSVEAITKTPGNSHGNAYGKLGTAADGKSGLNLKVIKNTGGFS